MKDGWIVKSAGISGEDMKKINRYTRREYKAEEVYTFSLTLCDNEIDRDHERFSVESLRTLKELFLGKTCIFDHERRSQNQTARIYDTWLAEEPEKTTRAGERYVKLMAKAYLPRTGKSGDVIERIESGILKEVSVSCSVKRTVCGICGQEQCGHAKGREYGGKPGHRVLLEPTDAYECSFVAVPAQRSAGVTKSYRKEETGMDVEKMLTEADEQGVTLTKAQAEELSGKLGELREKAAWGEQYRETLSAEIMRYGAILQPELPAAVLRAALKSLSMTELSAMEKAYAEGARKKLPLKPQLAQEDSGRKTQENGEFRI